MSLSNYYEISKEDLVDLSSYSDSDYALAMEEYKSLEQAYDSSLVNMDKVDHGLRLIDEAIEANKATGEDTTKLLNITFEAISGLVEYPGTISTEEAGNDKTTFNITRAVLNIFNYIADTIRKIIEWFKDKLNLVNKKIKSIKSKYEKAIKDNKKMGTISIDKIPSYYKMVIVLKYTEMLGDINSEYNAAFDNTKVTDAIEAHINAVKETLSTKTEMVDNIKKAAVQLQPVIIKTGEEISKIYNRRGLTLEKEIGNAFSDIVRMKKYLGTGGFHSKAVIFFMSGSDGLMDVMVGSFKTDYAFNVLAKENLKKDISEYKVEPLTQEVYKSTMKNVDGAQKLLKSNVDSIAKDVKTMKEESKTMVKSLNELAKNSEGDVKAKTKELTKNIKRMTKYYIKIYPFNLMSLISVRDGSLQFLDKMISAK